MLSKLAKMEFDQCVQGFIAFWNKTDLAKNRVKRTYAVQIEIQISK